MIWTVILKEGDSFVVNGVTYNSNYEIGKSLKARGLADSDVAGVVKGNHPVLGHPNLLVAPYTHYDRYSDQRRSAIAAPSIAPRDTQEELWTGDVDLSNDPIDW